MRALYPLTFAASGRRIGLLGGSFNPAHDGHLHLSRLVFRRLALDEIWWLVSPQNPLKPAKGMATLEQRLAAARRIARPRWIRVLALEAILGTRYTADTLRALQSYFPRGRFVWLMGADNLIQLSAWERWTEIMSTVPVAVVTRPNYSLRALASHAAMRYASARIGDDMTRSLADCSPPAWVFLRGPAHSASATAIRAQGRTDRLTA